MSETVNYTIQEPSRQQLELAVLPLRHEVLDPAREIWTDTSLSEEDFFTDVIHRAAFLEGGLAVSTVRIDNVATNGLHYMIRKMATWDGYSRAGIGSGVLAAAEEEARSRGARMFWLDARQTVIPYFEKNGYAQTGNAIMADDGVLNYRMKKVAERE